jgi:hypothetical protein
MRHTKPQAESRIVHSSLECELYETRTQLSYLFYTHPSMRVDHSRFSVNCQPFVECFYVCFPHYIMYLMIVGL